MHLLLLLAAWQAAVHFTHNPPRKSGGSEGAIHVSGAKVRIEEPSAGGLTVVIFDGQNLWLVFPERKEFLELPNDQAPLATIPPPSLKGMQQIGTEVIGGEPCTIWERTVGRIHQRLWVPDKKKFFHFLRQVTQTDHGATKADLTEVREVAQPDALFRVPKDFRTKELLRNPQ